MPSRRAMLAAAPALLALSATRPASATPATMRDAIAAFLGEGGTLREGRVAIDIPPLVENGNTVPIAITVESPMTPQDHVQRIGVFTERNPLPQVIVAHLGPRAGRAAITTRMRLATSQRIIAIAAMSDGSFWSESTEVVVTLAACVEG
ncbi:SoxY-related AACIE arm protein [Elioraea sp.]|uniref:SoxY-related AACIE arm protein n=1 Tax=Elioraea sp. TaxID=2185103 RepID=UPI0025BEE14D|nr:SoxY-related AACIE arm protein [Elioraea sp.]